jgi:baculoviral IAP repeat-containing protein 6
MILVVDPYFNEPGHEAYMKTPRGQAASADYNASLRVHTLRFAVLQALRAPAPAFAPAIRSHFRAKRAELAAQCDTWAAEARGGSKQAVRGLAAEVRAELAKL